MSQFRTSAAPAEPLGVWLIGLCACLAVLQPLALAAAATRAIGAMPLRGWPLGLLLTIRVVVAALGVGAALAIVGRHAGALRLTHVALLAWTVVEIVVRTTSIFPANRVPGDVPIYVAATLAYYLAWTVYLTRSKRVRRLLGP